MATQLKYHHAFAVEANGAIVENGVSAERLDAHIQLVGELYPSRALFVDGKCIIKGELNAEQIANREARLRTARVVVMRDTTALAH